MYTRVRQVCLVLSFRFCTHLHFLLQIGDFDHPLPEEALLSLFTFLLLVQFHSSGHHICFRILFMSSQQYSCYGFIISVMYHTNLCFYSNSFFFIYRFPVYYVYIPSFSILKYKTIAYLVILICLNIKNSIHNYSHEDVTWFFSKINVYISN